MSVCTATARSNRRELVEWIEYHRLAGIEHFFIYNTATHNQQNDIKQTLKDYIKEDIVTVIPWVLTYFNVLQLMDTW